MTKILFSSFQVRLLSSCLLTFVAIQFTGCEKLLHPSLEPFAAYVMRPSVVSMDSLRARFFGATTIQIDDGETAIMIDGFFSRPGLAQLLFTNIEPNETRISAGLRNGNVTNLAAVLVAHSHYDHVMDAAVVAERTGAMLLGSSSTANVGYGHDKLSSEKIHIPKFGEVRSFGRFTVEFFESPHSPDFWFCGEITHPLHSPVRFSSYKEGGSYSFVLRHPLGTILIHPSANYRSLQYKDVKTDVVFLSIGLLGTQPEAFAREYWQQVVRATGAKLVIPIHWDDLLRPLDEPLLPMPYLVDNFTAAMEILLKMADEDGVQVRFMPLFEAISVMEMLNELTGKSH
jgi:L-ascorbate metabolism protein UlaG (beta-lactamase superfamily)